MAQKRRVWRGLKRGLVTKLLRTLTSLTKQDAKQLARQSADPNYAPVLFAATSDVADMVQNLKDVCLADLAAKA